MAAETVEIRLEMPREEVAVLDGFVNATGRTHAAVSFGLLYLRDQELIEAFPDAARNPRFLRYRIKS